MAARGSPTLPANSNLSSRLAATGPSTPSSKPTPPGVGPKGSPSAAGMAATSPAATRYSFKRRKAGGSDPAASNSGGPAAPLGVVDTTTAGVLQAVDRSGRASRSEYWYFFRAVSPTNRVLAFLPTRELLLLAVFLAQMMAGTGAAVRQLHDTGRPGWMLLLSLIPLVGGIIVLAFLTQKPEPHPNQYG